MKRGLAILFGLLVSACAGQRAYNDGLGLIEEGRIEEGLARIEAAAKLEPDNRQYRQAYFRQRDLALQRYAVVADTAREQRQWEAAEAGYRNMLAIDKGNARALSSLERLQAERQQRVKITEAEELLKKDDVVAAHAKLREVLAENAGNREAQQLLRQIESRALRASTISPQLSAALTKLITLEFQDASLKQILDLVARNAGLNFIFDRDVRPDIRTTIYVQNSSIEDVLRFILVTNQLERKVLSANTILIFPNTPAKLRDYQDFIVKTFYLANSDVKAAASMLKAMVRTKDMHVDEKLGLIMIRDTPEAIRMAERLVANQDLAEPEVMLEVEVMEVARNVLSELGIRYPSQLSYSIVGAAGIPGTVTLPEWLNRNSNLVSMTISNPLLIFNLRNDIERANLLANPRIRVKNREKAKIHIGDKIPVITATSTATGFVAESVSYLDVGLKLDVEPTIFLEDEVGIRVALEVSNIVQQVRTTAGTLTYQIGTRNASTVLRLRDGETQVLAGLISDEERKTVNQVPGLGDLPLIGRLFGNHLDTRNKTEIVLLITPRIVRNLARPEARYEELAAGTDAVMGAAPLVFRSAATTSPGTAKPPISALVGPQDALPSGVRVLLSAPKTAAAGETFMILVSLDSEVALRTGNLDFAFDPSRFKFVGAERGAMLAAADGDAAFRVNAAELMGSLNINFSSKADLKGRGVLAGLSFQVIGQGAGPSAIRPGALSFSNGAGQLVSAPPPPSLTLSITR